MAAITSPAPNEAEAVIAARHLPERAGVPGASPSARQRVVAAARELVVIAAIYVLYRSVRLLTRDADDEALLNAHRVLDLERSLGLAVERGVQRVAMSSETFIALLNQYYVSAHFPVTVAFLVWAFVRAPRSYRLVRTWFVVVTFAAMVVHVLFPLAPPRMLPGFVDTLDTFGPRIYSGDPAESLANQFAAMPSLHFGWSLMVAVGFVVLRRSRWSLLALVHPVVTLLAIVATANHYWLDAAIAGLLVLGAAAVLRVARRMTEAQRPADGGAPAAALETVVILPGH